MTYQLNRFLQNQEQEQIQGPKSLGGMWGNTSNLWTTFNSTEAEISIN